MVSYKQINENYIEVYLGKKLTGSIARVPGGFQYRPKGKNKQSLYGDILPSIIDVKQSLEED